MLGFAGLTPEILLIFLIIALTVILIVTELQRVDVVASLVLVLLGVSQLVAPEMLFVGFSSDAVVSLIAIMIIGAGLERSGVMNWVAKWLLHFGQGNEKRISILLMISCGLSAGFMRSVGSVALFMPIITRVRRTTGIAKARLLMPLAFAAILGSTMTMVGTGPLIILNGLLSGFEGVQNVSGSSPEIGFFTVLPIGLALLLVGVVYFMIFGRFLLPTIPQRPLFPGGSLDYFKRTYQVGGSIQECRIPSNSHLVEKSLQELEEILQNGVQIIGIQSSSSVQMPPLRDTKIKAGTVVALLGPKDEIEALCKKHGLKLHSGLKVFKDYVNPAQGGLCEAVLPPSSTLVGSDFHKVHMRHRFGMQVLAILRGTKVYHGNEMQAIALRPGDNLAMFCEWQQLSQLEKSPDFVVVTTDYPREAYNTDKAGIALVLFVISMALVMWGSVSVPVGLLVGAMGMVVTGILSIDQAYSSVSWKNVFLYAGLIPLGIAVEDSGASAWITNQFLSVFIDTPIWQMEVGLAVVTTLLALAISNVGATIVLVPLAVQLAMAVGGDPKIFALTVAISASNAFLIPTHQANVLVLGPGRYKVRDFLRAGIGMTVLYLAVVMGMMHLLF